MDLTKHTQPTVEAIKQYWHAKGSSQKKRHYLGGSMVGSHCERKLWYDFRHMTEEDFDGRLYRLFQRGHNEEHTFVEELRGAGVTVQEVGKDGEQFGFKAVGGHVAGHLDGVGKGLLEAPETWHLLEFKTHSAKSFKELQKDGVEKSKPQHFAQMQLYMKWAKLTRAFYLSVNKDNDELYSERLDYDADRAEALEAKAKRIVESQHAPERPYSRRDYYLCKWCSAQDLCWGSEEKTAPAIDIKSLSCRQCMHATPEMDGNARWSCNKHKTDRSYDEQCNPCRDLLLIPSLVEWAKPIDVVQDDDGREALVFEDDDGNTWQHGQNARCNQYSAGDLITMPRSLIGSAGMTAVKTILGGNVAKVEPDMAYRYTHASVVWTGIRADMPSALKAHGITGKSTLEASCDEWNAAEWGDIAAFVHADGKCEIKNQKV